MYVVMGWRQNCICPEIFARHSHRFRVDLVHDPSEVKAPHSLSGEILYHAEETYIRQVYEVTTKIPRCGWCNKGTPDIPWLGHKLCAKCHKIAQNTSGLYTHIMLGDGTIIDISNGTTIDLKQPKE